MVNLKLISVGVSALGLVASLASDWVADRKLDEKVEQKVNEALAKQSEENEDEES